MNMQEMMDIAYRAGNIAEHHKSRGLQKFTKPDGTFVTSGDYGIAEFGSGRCAANNIAYLGEEKQVFVPGMTKAVIVDEIDGTSDYIKGGHECAFAMTFGTLKKNRFTPKQAVINNWGGLGCFGTDGSTTWRELLSNTIEVKPPQVGNGPNPRVVIARWPTAWYPMEDIVESLQSAGMIVTNPGSVVTPVLYLLLGMTDAVIFPGANNAKGVKECSSAHEATAVSLFAKASDAEFCDLKGEPIAFDAIESDAAYPDFRLKHGFMAARSPELRDYLLAVIAKHVTNW